MTSLTLVHDVIEKIPLFLQTTDDPATPAAEKAEAVVEVTVDVLSFVAGAVVGALVGLVTTIVLMSISHLFAGRYKYYTPVHTTIRKPLGLMLIVLGAWIGFGIVAERIDESHVPHWYGWLNHAFLILFIVVAAGAIVSLTNGLVKSVYLRMEVSSEERASRIETQVQVIHRVVGAIIWVLAVGLILLTFPAARTAGTSLLASAGLLSVVAGLAAQSVLGNVFAGLQLAFSDSMRVGDIVYFNDLMATVEEITLTYVVLAVWDGRRIMVPSTKMTEEPFENWTRRSPEMMGMVEWQVDWAVPVQQARKQLDHLLANTDLWDGRTGVLQVAEAVNGAILLRAIVSARNAGALIDLRHYLRESMVEWIQHEAPQAIPHYRRIVDDAPNFAEATEATEARVDKRLGSQPPAFTPDSPTTTTAATTVISRSELEKFARTPLAERVGDDNFEMKPVTDEFDVVGTDEAPAGYQSAIFHGSEEAEKRAEQYAGPGEDAYEERNRKLEQTANTKKVDADDHTDSTTDEEE
ncbi:mechanosensitive ion channel family protein [Arcanobacterium phocae]|uniref:mechanosensitive ion channel family protein n=1 Tax=Arcanobacterium phocae TaxID=131112 RepID=UPI001C1117C4|nr:mechanosensitive ion channel domain-containing protein [Arcanobacterium phocae]